MMRPASGPWSGRAQLALVGGQGLGQLRDASAARPVPRSREAEERVVVALSGRWIGSRVTRPATFSSVAAILAPPYPSAARSGAALSSSLQIAWPCGDELARR